MMEVFHILSFFAPLNIDEDRLYILAKSRQVLRGYIFGEVDSVELVEEYFLGVVGEVVNGDGEDVELKLPLEEGFNFIAVNLLTK